MDKAYLERVAADLYTRASTIILNGEQTLPIQNVWRIENQVFVQAALIKNISRITSIKLLDEQGSLITERKANINVPDEQTLAFTFQFQVKGGEINAVRS
ncbi:hypothetical protein [Aneurinibacillus aneurinilyticus]|uniref:hypothetical protein n=1 Tax=Aneurinibacillus aneurinilyticus TaxID=1391 RepID=UPI0035253C96